MRALCFVLLCAHAAGADLLWPLEIGPALSSSFAESRSTAFHAGIDIKTWGKTGYPVRAIDDGHVVRVRTSPWGYGRAVYQRLADGRYAVYAHLQSFAPEIDRKVEAAQRQKGLYSVELWFEEGEMPVRRGQVLAQSGESGAGPPHLHLELRDRENVPINPLRHGFSVADTLPPVLQKVALMPLGRESLVEGGHEPVLATLRWNARSRLYECERTFQVQGRFGVCVLAYDQANAAANKLAPYSVLLRVDGKPVFTTAYDRVAYGDMHQVWLDRTGLEGGYFFNLFRRPGNRLPFYQGEGVLETGRKGLKKGAHELEVEALDVYGNASRTRLRVRVNALPQLTRARLVETDGERFLEVAVEDGDDERLEVVLSRSRDGQQWREETRHEVVAGIGPLNWRLEGQEPLWRLEVGDGRGGTAFAALSSSGRGGAQVVPRMEVERRLHADFCELVLRLDQVPSGLPRVQVGGMSALVRQVGLMEFRAEVPLQAGGAPQLVVEAIARGLGGLEVRQSLHLEQRAVLPGRAVNLSYGRGEVELRFAEDSAYEVLFPQAERFEPQVPEFLRATGVAWALGPEGVPFDGRVGLRLRWPQGVERPERLGIYVGDGEKWALAGNGVDSLGKVVMAELRGLGRFALLEDVEAPVVRDVQPSGGAVVKEGRPLVSAFVDDRGSGIGREEDIVVLLDGVRVVVEYDPEAGRVVGRPWEGVGRGRHEVVVRVRDLSGNEGVGRGEFVVE